MKIQTDNIMKRHIFGEIPCSNCSECGVEEFEKVLAKRQGIRPDCHGKSPDGIREAEDKEKFRLSEIVKSAEFRLCPHHIPGIGRDRHRSSRVQPEGMGAVPAQFRWGALAVVSLRGKRTV